MSSGRALHPTLQRQLARSGIDLRAGATPAQLATLVERINRAYIEQDDDRYTFERSVAISSAEMEDLHTRLSSERDRLKTIFHAIGVSVLRADYDGTIVETNARASEVLKTPDGQLAGRKLADLMHPDGLTRHRQLWADLVSGRTDSFQEETRYLLADGSVLETDTIVSSVDPDTANRFVIVTVRDVTDLKRLELDLRLSQKLESVGRLAAGIAHEINTPIQFIGDNTQFLRSAFESLLTLYRQVRQHLLEACRSCEGESGIRLLEEAADFAYLVGEVPSALDATADGVTRVTTIVRAMRAFAHPDSATPVAADLTNALQSTLTVARNEIKYVADVVTEFADLPPLVCYLGDLNQVFLNLIVNAAHAMADVQEKMGRRGTLTVRTRLDGNTVVISFTDTGTGIASTNVQKVFDPFFTTKAVGKGTGQGLAMARAVVERHGGTITLETELGRGTTFFVALPLDGPPSQSAISGAALAPARAATR